jgi:hypothetical protein
MSSCNDAHPRRRALTDAYTFTRLDVERKVLENGRSALRDDQHKNGEDEKGLHTAEYRAVRFSTRRSPVAGQYAAGMPFAVARGSCGEDMYPCNRSSALALTAPKSTSPFITILRRTLGFIDVDDQPKDESSKPERHIQREPNLGRVGSLRTIDEIRRKTKNEDGANGIHAHTCPLVDGVECASSSRVPISAAYVLGSHMIFEAEGADGH